MVFSMNMKLNTGNNKYDKRLSIFCLIFTFILLVGAIYALKPVNAETGILVLTGCDPETTIIDSNGDIHKIPGEKCIRLYFVFESKSSSEDVWNDPFLHYWPSGDVVTGVAVQLLDFKLTSTTPAKYYSGTLEIYDIDAMIPLGDYGIYIEENFNHHGVPTFQYVARLTLSTVLANLHNVRFFDWNEATSSFTMVPDMYGDQMIERGKSAFEPPVVRDRYGYTFTRWDKSFTNVQASLDVQAVYTPNVYTVTFDANADTYLTAGPDPLNQDVIFDSVYGQLAEVNRAHYTFDGWFTKPIGGNKVTASTTLNKAFATDTLGLQVMEDHTLYAHWTPVTYEIIYELAGTDSYPAVNSPLNPVLYTVLNTFPISINEPTRFAYDFQGWKITYADKTTETLPSDGVPDGTTGNIILTAQWTPTIYDITYNLGGGKNADQNPDSYTVEDLLRAILAPSKLGYNFLGWNVEYSDNTPSVSKILNYVIPYGTACNIKLDAIWSDPIEYKIIYELDGGVNAPSNPDSYNIEELPVSITNPTKTDNVFLGWIVKCENGSTVTGLKIGYEIPEETAGDITLRAQWLPAGGLTKTINQSGPLSIGGQISYDISYVYDVPAILPNTKFEIIDFWTPENSIEYDNYVLTLDGTPFNPPGIVVTPAVGRVTFEFELSNIHSDQLLSLTVTFKVKEVKEGILNEVSLAVGGVGVGGATEELCLVSYAPNYPAGSTGQSGSVPDSYLYVAESDVTVVGNSGGLAVDGYVFIGWNTAATGSGTSYVENDVFKITKDTVLYALWVPSNDVITKEFSDNSVGPYAVGDSVKYVVSYTIPNNAWSLKSFEIIDTYDPASGLSYDSAIVKINGVPASSSTVTIASSTGEVNFAFTPSSLTVGAKVEIEITFKVVAVTDGGVSNKASASINSHFIDDDEATLYSLAYLPGATSVTGNVPVAKNFYETGATVTVLANLANTGLTWEVHAFIGWLYNGKVYQAGEEFKISEDVELVAQWVPLGVVTKTVNDDGSKSYGVNDLVEYVISYTLPSDVSSITSFKIIDTYSTYSLSYNSFTLKIDNTDATSDMTASNDATAGEVTFTLNDISTLKNDKIVTLTVTFTIKSVTNSISNTAEVKINNSPIGTDDGDLFLVSYNANWPDIGDSSISGSVPTSYLYAAGSTVTVVGNTGSLAVDGWLFIGWSMDTDGNSGILVAGNTFTVTENTVLYAQWIPVYSVTYDVNGGVAGSGPATVEDLVTGNTVTLDVTVAVPSHVDDDGEKVVFVYWSLTQTNTIFAAGEKASLPVKVDEVTIAVSDVTVFAVWGYDTNGNDVPDVLEDTFSVTYDVNGGVAGSGVVPTDDSLYLSGDSVVVLGHGDLELAGYSFIGWLYDGVVYNEGDTFTIDANVELVAQWVIRPISNVYTISYVLEGGVNAPGNPSFYVVEDLPLFIADPIRAGYDFLGWTVLYDDGSEAASQFSYSIPVGTVGDVVLYAVWNPAIKFVESYDIFYVLEGGVNAPGNPSFYVVEDLPLSITDPTRDGYTFLGWMVEYADNSTFGPVLDFSISEGTVGDIVLTACWVEVPEIRYSVTYNGNGHTGGTVPVDSMSPYVGGSLVSVLGQGSLSRSGYTFLGWATSPSASTVTYTAGSTFTIVADTVLYAVWRQTTSESSQSSSPSYYTVTYQPGAHGTFTTQTIRNLAYGAPTPVAPKVTGESGWTFAGWSPVPSTTVTGNAVYVAQWIQEQPALLIVQFVDWDETILKSQNIPYGGNATAPNDPTREGYTFTGWDLGYTNIVSNLTITAQYTISEPQTLQTWALVNLILSVVGLILAIIVLICVLLKKKQKQKKEQDEPTAPKNQNSAEHKEDKPTDDEKTKKQKQHQTLWILSLILGIAGIIVFLLTENTSLPMALIDQWTIVNAIIFIVELIAIALLIFNRKKKDDRKEDDNKDNTTPSSPNSTLNVYSTLNNSNTNNIH